VFTEAAESGGETGSPALAEAIAWGTLTNIGAKVVIYGSWFFLTPFILHRVGATQYGLWALIGSLAAFGTLLDLGIGSAVTKRVAEFATLGDMGALRRLVSTALWLYSGLGLVALGAATIAAPLVPRLFNVPPGQESTAEWLTVATGLALAVELPTSCSYSVLRGLGELPLLTLITSTSMIFTAGGIVLVLEAGGGLVGVVLVNVATALVMQIPMIALIHRRLPGLSVRPRHADRREVRSIMSFSASVFMIDAASKIGTRSDEIVIGSFLPVARVVPFTVAKRVAGLPQLAAAQFEVLILPAASALGARSEMHRIRELSLVSTRVTLAVFLSVGCGVAVLAKPFLSAWVGPAYAGSASVVLLLTASWFIAMSIWPFSAVLQALSRHRPLARFALGAAALNLALSIALVRPLGVDGVAVGTLVATTIEVVCFIVPYTLRTLELALGDLVRRVLLPVLAPVPPTLLVLFGLRNWIDPVSLVAVVAVASVGAMAYTAAYITVFADASERRALRGVATRISLVARRQAT